MREGRPPLPATGGAMHGVAGSLPESGGVDPLCHVPLPWTGGAVDGNFADVRAGCAPLPRASGVVQNVRKPLPRPGRGVHNRARTLPRNRGGVHDEAGPLPRTRGGVQDEAEPLPRTEGLVRAVSLPLTRRHPVDARRPKGVPSRKPGRPGDVE